MTVSRAVINTLPKVNTPGISKGSDPTYGYNINRNKMCNTPQASQSLGLGLPMFQQLTFMTVDNSTTLLQCQDNKFQVASILHMFTNAFCILFFYLRSRGRPLETLVRNESPVTPSKNTTSISSPVPHQPLHNGTFMEFKPNNSEYSFKVDTSFTPSVSYANCCKNNRRARCPNQTMQPLKRKNQVWAVWKVQCGIQELGRVATG